MDVSAFTAYLCLKLAGNFVLISVSQNEEIIVKYSGKLQ